MLAHVQKKCGDIKKELAAKLLDATGESTIEETYDFGVVRSLKLQPVDKKVNSGFP